MPAATANCPSCGGSLPVHDDAAYCVKCDLHLVGARARGKRLTGYLLSLPERMSRILAGSLAGLVKGLTEILLPDAVRRMKLYQVLLMKNLRYLIQKVGDVDGVYPEGPGVTRNYIARKFVGNFVELTGILTLRASPVWILALVSDISGGTKAFLEELTAQLKREKLLDPSARIATVDQLLDGLQSFAGQVADRIDTPPLSVEELRETLKYLRQEAQTMRLRRTVTPGEMESILEKMQRTAEQQQRSLYEISSAMALNAFNQLERSGRTAVTGLRVAGALLDRSILQYYSSALRDLSRLGYYRYLAGSARPYLKAIRRHLARKNITWTERYFLSRSWNRIGMIPDKRKPPSPDARGAS